MPLARLSIKSALQVARGSVSLHRLRGVADLWFVRTRYGHGVEAAVSQSEAMPRAAARAARRECRVMVALLAIGLEPAVALGLAVKAKDHKSDWRKLVARYAEQHDLS